MTRVMVPEALGPHQALPDRLRAHGCEVVCYQSADRHTAVALLADADIYLSTPSQRFVFDANLIALAPRLRAANSLVIGTETIDVQACTDAGIIVGNGAVPENYLGVAEATIMLMLALGLELKRKERGLRDGVWRVADNRSALLHGRTVGLIGLGRIGRAVVDRLQGWGAEMLVYDPYVAPTTVPAWVELVPLAELLGRADVVSIHVALTHETRGLLGARELGLMKAGACLVNTARGGIVDEQALADALSAGRLAGAAIDTWAQEPTSPDNPLLSVDPDRVILTGHSIAHSARLAEDIMQAAVENVLREARGDLPLYTVNPNAEPRWRARLARMEVY